MLTIANKLTRLCVVFTWCDLHEVLNEMIE